MDGMNLEIWFPQQDQVTVFLESSVIDSDEERFHETSFFALFATRQIANLGTDWVGQSLAATLSEIDLDRPADDALEKLGDVELVTPSTPGGRKGFTAELVPEKRGFFKMHPRGFGMLGKGVSYYAPTSTVAFLAYLLDRRRDDAEYTRALTTTAKMVGHAGAQGAIRVTTSAQVAMQAAAAGWSFAIEAESDEETSGDGAQRRVLATGIRVAEQHGVELPDIVNDLARGLASQSPDPETRRVYPIEALRGQCALEFLTAAMIEDPRMDEAYARAESSANLREVALLVLEDRGLTPVLDAMMILISTDDWETL